MKKIKDCIKNKINPFIKRHENLIGVILGVLCFPFACALFYLYITTAHSVILPIEFDAFNPDHIILLSASLFSVLSLYYVINYVCSFSECIVGLFKTKKDTD